MRLARRLRVDPGVVCGVRIENLKDALMKEISYLDKLVDESRRVGLWIGSFGACGS